jgi:hypothetical protein
LGVSWHCAPLTTYHASEPGCRWPVSG